MKFITGGVQFRASQHCGGQDPPPPPPNTPGLPPLVISLKICVLKLSLSLSQLCLLATYLMNQGTNFNQTFILRWLHLNHFTLMMAATVSWQQKTQTWLMGSSLAWSLTYTLNTASDQWSTQDGFLPHQLRQKVSQFLQL